MAGARDLGRGPDGKRQRKIGYGPTRQTVASQLNTPLGRAESGELLVTSTPTVASWLNHWFTTHARDWTNRRTYRAAIDLWIVPAIGTIRLEQLKPASIQHWINEATKDRARPRTDIDVSARTLRVRQQVQALGAGLLTLAPLKTLTSRHRLTLPTLAVEALKRHRVRQLEERLRASEAWRQGDDLVLTMPNGRAVHPGHARDVLTASLAQAGLPHMKFHVLRHSAATLLLMDGTPLFDVPRILGHATTHTTSDIYGHLVDEITAGAAARMDAPLAKKNA